MKRRLMASWYIFVGHATRPQNAAARAFRCPFCRPLIPLRAHRNAYVCPHLHRPANRTIHNSNSPRCHVNDIIGCLPPSPPDVIPPRSPRWRFTRLQIWLVRFGTSVAWPDSRGWSFPSIVGGRIAMERILRIRGYFCVHSVFNYRNGIDCWRQRREENLKLEGKTVASAFPDIECVKYAGIRQRMLRRRLFLESRCISLWMLNKTWPFRADICERHARFSWPYSSWRESFILREVYVRGLLRGAKIGLNCGGLNFKALAIVGQISKCRRHCTCLEDGFLFSYFGAGVFIYCA